MNTIVKEYRNAKGELHRPWQVKLDGGPAVIWSNGTQSYWYEGKLHRPWKEYLGGGPARIYSDGTLEYWEYGTNKTLEEFKAISKIQSWFRYQRFMNRFRPLFEQVLGLPANHDSVLGRMYPGGGDLYKEVLNTLNGLETVSC